MSDDALKDLIDTPNGDNGPDVYWEVSLMAVTKTGHGPTWEFDIPVEEKARMDTTQFQGTRERLEFVDIKGARHIWFDVKIVALVESTPETRRIARVRHANGELHMEKVKREQRRISGEWGGGE